NITELNPNRKVIISQKIDILITHFGLSVPAALRCSQFVVKAMKNFKTNTVQMSIDELREENSEKLFKRMLKQMKEDP
ncbi:NAD(P)/FAD-dependent oxidoreductase, partial [Bacillus cereus]|nr:NAD(P)/FAD-dependent oxidoreductase [Bacillus cereus]